MMNCMAVSGCCSTSFSLSALQHNFSCVFTQQLVTQQHSTCFAADMWAKLHCNIASFSPENFQKTFCCSAVQHFSCNMKQQLICMHLTTQLQSGLGGAMWNQLSMLSATVLERCRDECVGMYTTQITLTRLLKKMSAAFTHDLSFEGRRGRIATKISQVVVFMLRWRDMIESLKSIHTVSRYLQSKNFLHTKESPCT